jgi:hypothetical protein
MFPGICGKPKADFPALADACNQGWIIPATESRHLRQRCDRHGGHPGPAIVPGREIELPYSVALDRGLFQFIEPDSFVLREKQPSVFADGGQPSRVFGPREKYGPVALVPDSVLGESVENGLAVVKVFVEVKDEVFRQRYLPSAAAPTGWLLRSVLP